jgi:UPF0176 protein
MNSKLPFMTAAFYKFVDFPDFADRREKLLALCEYHNVKGLIILAKEGINSTIAGSEESVMAILNYLKTMPEFLDLQYKVSWSAKQPFYRMKVRLKKEIVTIGLPDISPIHGAGTYVPAEKWNALIQDPDVILIDTRNDYEVELGTFQGAIDPQVKKFSDLPQWLDAQANLKGDQGKKPKVAMFCTGGIRCEKSTALMKAKGFDEVYHLEGGILKYLEKIPQEQSLWQGECFVFDERVSVGHGLIAGEHELCRCCRDPLQEGAKSSPQYEFGVSCPRCFDRTTEDQKARARERHKQTQLAKARGEIHFGMKKFKPSP